jgi:hypothetical protein
MAFCEIKTATNGGFTFTKKILKKKPFNPCIDSFIFLSYHCFYSIACAVSGLVRTENITTLIKLNNESLRMLAIRNLCSNCLHLRVIPCLVFSECPLKLKVSYGTYFF